MTIWITFLEGVRMRIGARLLDLAVQLLPENAWQRKAITRDLAEQRQYERYEGYSLLMGAAVLPFDRWRSEWSGMSRLRKPLKMPQRQERSARSMWA
jgi:hypothetical protein